MSQDEPQTRNYAAHLKTTPTDNAWLDEVFEVKIADDQKGYLWAKLSPKSKATIITHIDTVRREAVMSELGWHILLQKERLEAGNKSAYTTLRVMQERLAELAAQTPPLNPNKDTPNE